MSCSPYDLRDYLFEELNPSQRGEVRLHLKTCAPCSSEIQSLRLTHSTLLAVRDEEMPRRIGFVSDKVFEPSPLRRWFNGFWTSAARIGFVSSAMLSAAILVHAVRFVPNVHNNAQSAQITRAEIDRRINAAVEVNTAKLQAQFAAAVTQAVARAVNETDKNAQKRTNAILAAAERRGAQERQTLRAEYAEYMRSRRNVALVAQNYGGGPQ